MLLNFSFLLMLTALTNSINSQKNASYAVDKISKELSKKASVVIRQDQTSVVLESVDRYTSEHRQVITIMNQKGDAHLDFVAGYKEGSSEVRDINVRYYDKNGALIRKVKSKEIDDYAAHDGISLISDSRMKVFDYEAADYPITVEKSWKQISSTTLFLPAWSPIPGTNISVEYSSYKLENKSKVKIRVNEKNISNFPITKASNHHYELHSQPVIFSESYSPSSLERYPIVYMVPVKYKYEGYQGKFENWDQFGDWIYQSLLSDKADLDKISAKADLDRIIATGDSKREIAKKIYDYVQENTRYILIGLDEGGLVPLSAQKVHDVKYGDCKALSFYTKSLLEVYDIPANYVIVRAGSNMPEDIYEDYAHVAPANHAIINIPLPNDTIWLDCTSHNNPFNFLGTFTDDRLALQVNENGGKLVRTPIYDGELNKNIVSGAITFDPQGNVDIEMSIEDHGLKMSKLFYLENMNPKEFDEYLSTSLLSKFAELKVSDHKLSVNEELLKGTQKYKFTAATYGEKAGDYMIFESALMPMPIPRLKKDSNRENEIVFPREEKYISKLEYHVPQGYRWSIPDETTLESQYGSYTQTVTEKEMGVYELQRTFILNKGRYSQEKYNDLKLFFDKIRKAEKSKQSVSNKS